MDLLFSSSGEELIEITYNLDYYSIGLNVNKFRYTTETKIFTNEYGEKFFPIAWERGAIKKSDKSGNEISISMSIDSELAEIYKTSSVKHSSTEATVVIYQLDQNGNPFVFWTGKISSASFQDARINISCRSMLDILDQNALNDRTQPTCNHKVYSARCGVNYYAFSKEVTVTALENKKRKIFVSGITEDTGYFVNGWAHIDTEKLMIVNHNKTDSSISVLTTPKDIVVGSKIRIAKGCTGTIIACREFNNVDNFFGFPNIPIKNPFK